jgi:lipopolysaccharide transport system ATP-binding protein
VLLEADPTDMCERPVVIGIEHLSKRYILHHERARSFQEVAIGWGKRLLRKQTASPDREVFWALQNVNLQIRQGETIGLIGRNGSGKSTLLKLICGIVQPTAGTIAVLGRISALLELGSGFHPDVSGRENVFFAGSLMGLSRREMQQHYDQIVAFSELERFIDMPIKHYSSGMHMRLAFATAVVVNPDILLIDEILAVGDEAFGHKSFNKIMELRNQNRTIVVVSHVLDLLRQLCTRVIWLQDGQVVADGTPDEVIDQYLLTVNVPTP